MSAHELRPSTANSNNQLLLLCHFTFTFNPPSTANDKLAMAPMCGVSVWWWCCCLQTTGLNRLGTGGKTASPFVYAPKCYVHFLHTRGTSLPGMVQRRRGLCSSRDFGKRCVAAFAHAYKSAQRGEMKEGRKEGRQRRVRRGKKNVDNSFGKRIFLKLRDTCLATDIRTPM